MGPVNAEKTFPLQFCKLFLFTLPEKPPHASVKTFLRYMAIFAKIGAFPLGVFSIRDFNLRNLKGNGTRLVTDRHSAWFTHGSTGSTPCSAASIDVCGPRKKSDSDCSYICI